MLPNWTLLLLRDVHDTFSLHMAPFAAALSSWAPTPNLNQPAQYEENQLQQPSTNALIHPYSI